MFEVNAKIYDKEKNRKGIVLTCEYKQPRMDYLYTIQYDNGEYGRYYGKHMSERFSLVVEYNNVVRFDFKNKVRVA